MEILHSSRQFQVSNTYIKFFFKNPALEQNDPFFSSSAFVRTLIKNAFLKYVKRSLNFP